MDFFKLESLCDEIIDCPHSTPRWLDSGIRVIRNYNLNGAHFDFSKSSYVDEETYLNRTKEQNQKQTILLFRVRHQWGQLQSCQKV